MPKGARAHIAGDRKETEGAGIANRWEGTRVRVLGRTQRPREVNVERPNPSWMRRLWTAVRQLFRPPNRTGAPRLSANRASVPLMSTGARVPQPWRQAEAVTTLDPGALRARLVGVLLEERARAEAPGDLAYLDRLLKMAANEVMDLPVFPDAARKLDRLLRSPQVDGTAVVAVIREDPDMVRRVWAAAIETRFGRGAGSLDQAIARMGFDAVWRVGMEACLHASVFRVPRLQAQIERVRRRGLATAEIAAWMGDDPRGDLWLAGMMHEAGLLSFYRYAQPGVGEDGPQLALIERLAERLHPAVGVLMVQAWGLSPGVAAGVGFWPEPHLAGSLWGDSVLIVRAAAIAARGVEEARQGRDCGALETLRGMAELGMAAEDILRFAAQTGNTEASGPTRKPTVEDQRKTG